MAFTARRPIAWLRVVIAMPLRIAPAFQPGTDDLAGCSPIPGQLSVGAYVAGAPFEADRLDEFSAMVASVPDIVMWYQDWTERGVRDFVPARADAIKSRGSIPMLTWDPWDRTRPGANPFSLAAIADGQHDAYVRRFARAASEWGQEVWMRFAHEMNGDWYPWGQGVNGNTPASFVGAWQHVVDLFRVEGAHNVRWIWSPNVNYAGAPPLAPLYPGDDYVDWLGMDGYNWGDDRWLPARLIFLDTYAEICRLTQRPKMIAEIGSAESGGLKADWITEAFAAVRDEMPAVRAIVWFHEDKERDWRLNSSAGALAAFRLAMSSR